jgi:hypothetical protein
MNATTRAIILVLTVMLVGPAALAVQAEPDGFIYGTITTESGHEYTGMMRWGTEEAFWDDLFNSTKGELPYLEDHRSETRRRSKIKVFGVTVGYHWDHSSSGRMYIARFGDIARIDVKRGDDIVVTMKDGEVYEMEGGSNDIGATVTVLDDSIGEVELEWGKIDKVVFAPAPSKLKPPAYRLYGTVETDSGSFEGHIQWDVQECLSTDRLDGETDDGDLAIDMGKIRAIEKNNRSGSRVLLKDGRKLILEDTNDVDDSLRGIHVDDPRFGRVKISWEAFERVEFTEVADSGRGYDDYKPGKHLRGTITDYEGRTHSGEFVFDLDEERSWELLNGSRDEVEYYIPFDLIRSIEPLRNDRSKLVLKSGTELELEDGQDVSESNDGIVVLREDDRESYFPWDQIKQINFD